MQTLESFEQNNEYTNILQFSKEHNIITSEQLDEYILKNINIFDVPSDEYFYNIDEILNKIIKSLPAIKRIFAHPIIHLKDNQEVVPIEAAKVINNYTLSHIALHSELWENITNEGIKPKKIMTIEKIENFVSYENIAFTRLIDAILKFINKTIVVMKDILYGCQDIHFNLLDRTHHKLYFLAIGKLHIEYAQAHERHYSSYLMCIDKLLFIEKTLQAKLSSPVYLACKKNKNKISLKKTNVFRSHKDYKQVYDLLKYFETDIEQNRKNVNVNEVNNEEYINYCTILSLFALEHFNFTFPINTHFNLLNIDTVCNFIDWSISFKRINYCNINCLKFHFHKEKDYNICLVFNDFEQLSFNDFEVFKQNVKSDEYIYTSPKKDIKKNNLYLNIYDIDSFRKLQQAFLRGMIYCDEKHNICPFCGHSLEKVNDIYECKICRCEIKEEVCPKTKETYFISGIKKYKSFINNKNYEQRKFLHDHYAEGQFHFRNITKITSNGKVICPKCGNVHN